MPLYPTPPPPEPPALAADPVDKLFQLPPFPPPVAVIEPRAEFCPFVPFDGVAIGTSKLKLEPVNLAPRPPCPTVTDTGPVGNVV